MRSRPRTASSTPRFTNRIASYRCAFCISNLPDCLRQEAAVRSLIEVLEHTEGEAVGGPTGLDGHTRASAKEAIQQPAQEGLKPETTRARRVALGMGNR